MKPLHWTVCVLLTATAGSTACGSRRVEGFCSLNAKGVAVRARVIGWQPSAETFETEGSSMQGTYVTIEVLERLEPGDQAKPLVIGDRVVVPGTVASDGSCVAGPLGASLDHDAVLFLEAIADEVFVVREGYFWQEGATLRNVEYFRNRGLLLSDVRAILAADDPETCPTEEYEAMRKGGEAIEAERDR